MCASYSIQGLAQLSQGPVPYRVRSLQGYPNYIKEPTQQMIDSKVQHKNYIKTNEHKENQHTCSRIYLIQEGQTIIKEWDNQPSKEESKVPTKKPSPPHFSWWRKVSKRKKRFVFQKHKREKEYCSKRYRKAPPWLVHYLEFAFECKMHTNRIITLQKSIKTPNMIK